MKFLLVVVVLAVVAGWLFTRSRRGRKLPPTAPVAPAKGDAPSASSAMLACAHCGLHVPKDDAHFDMAGKPYCSAEHCVTGPR